MRFRSVAAGLAFALVGLPGTPLPATADAARTVPTLVSVQARHVGNVDRVTFTFRDGLPQSVFLEWVDTLHYDGSGKPARVAGSEVLAVYLNGAVAHDEDGATVRNRTAYALPNVITSVGAGDFIPVPAFTVHRESNPTTEPPLAVIARAGGGIPTVNVPYLKRPGGPADA